MGFEGKLGDGLLHFTGMPLLDAGTLQTQSAAVSSAPHTVAFQQPSSSALGPPAWTYSALPGFAA